MPPATTVRYCDALHWAAQLHAGQRRKGSGHPYVAHLLSVSSLVWRDGGDEDEAIAALLHDAIEDQGVTAAEVRERFGSRVAAIVQACTDADSGPGVPKPSWRDRKQAHLAALADVRDSGTLRVLAADKVDNAASVVADHDLVGARIWDIFTGGRDGTVWYYAQMLALLERNAPGLGLTGRLAGLVADLRARAAADAVAASLR